MAECLTRPILMINIAILRLVIDDRFSLAARGVLLLGKGFFVKFEARFPEERCF